MFTGQQNVASIGLYFYNARFYDAYLNRWIQPDSIIPEAVQGVQAWDRYAYTNNNPVKYTDPTGHSVDDCPPGDTACGEIQAPPPEDKVSVAEGVATIIDIGCAGANALYALVGGVITFAYPPAAPVVLEAYQPFSVAVNSLSTLSGLIWTVNDIATGESGFSVHPSTHNVAVYVGQDTVVAFTTNILGWTVVRDPLTAAVVDTGVVVYDMGRNVDVIPTVLHPTITTNPFKIKLFP